jgi:hypothetical protein
MFEALRSAVGQIRKPPSRKHRHLGELLGPVAKTEGALSRHHLPDA